MPATCCADELLREAAGGVTLLHAAVLGGAAAALPLLVAGGTPPDAEIPWEWPAQSPPQVAPAAAAFLQSFGYNCDELDVLTVCNNLAVRWGFLFLLSHRLCWLLRAYVLTPVAVVCSCPLQDAGWCRSGAAAAAGGPSGCWAR